MPIAVVTRTRIRPRFVLRFMWLCLRIGLQARRTEGYVAGAMRLSNGPEFWTLTVWESGRAMQALRNNGVHGEAMPSLARWADEGTTAIWRTEGGARPDWTEAQSRLEASARFTAIDDPSDEHARAVIRPAPRWSGTFPVPAPRATNVRSSGSPGIGAGVSTAAGDVSRRSVDTERKNRARGNPRTRI